MSLDWMTAAVCAGVDPELWFPESGDSRPARICQGCPVRQQCEEYAAALEGDCGLPYRHGVWGGTSAKERAEAREQTRSLKDDRDEQILRLAEHGVGPKEIAALVGVTDRTVHRVKQRTAPDGCGTTKAYYRHLLAGEDIDPACQAASDAYEQQLVVPPPPECGTRGGYERHRRQGEPACTPCRQANADADRRFRNTGTTTERSAA
ncbi:WhiB family transcriptional regulator [Streptomyces sp. NE06-03C]|uniref:WhiB family transcriptional regulator n=1 Tax=Streptomyces sp. NE06-03C TaxID=3028694 RepID=UPI0029AD0AEB|nr:WhiB family transcriptional regulator [Streptomyces sp. NE06-03C]MDX2921842.1 WhiB family transcriptional regulator [Streptomyces sp. NE06-03C]